MTDARLIWQVWRQILMSDRLVTHVIGADAPGDGDVMAGMSESMRAIVDDYARTPVETATNISMYRQGLARNALGALSLVPLSRHILFMSDLDIDLIAEQFAEASGYVDYGPNFWQAAGAFVEYFATRPEFADPVRQDIFALDRASVALARRLGSDPPAHWPADTGGDPRRRSPAATEPVIASGAAVVVRSRHDLSEWIENPGLFDPDEAPPETSGHWLVYFPTADADRAYVQLSARAADIYAGLATPRTPAWLASALDLPLAQLLDVVESLHAAGLVRDAAHAEAALMPALAGSAA